MELQTRRTFTTQMLGSLAAFGLIETLFAGDLFGDAIKPVIRQWMTELNGMAQDLKTHQLKDTEFQAKLEDLYRRVNLEELIEFVELDRLTKGLQYPAKGAANLGIDLSKVAGLPSRLVFGKQIFAMTKGRSVVPHGHDNMCTGFIVLRGDFTGKHYDRVEDHADHYLIRPTIDRTFRPGECSTISDHKDNVHWFKAQTDTAFIFNVHIMGYNPESTKTAARIYIDPEGEKAAGGLTVARKISSAECHRKYG